MHATEDQVTQSCPGCGRPNRVLRARLGNAVCGACKAQLFSTAPRAVTEATWGPEVERSALPVLVDFWATWCGPCRAVAPMLAELAAGWAGRLAVVKVDIDQNPGLAARFGVQAVPTLMVFRGGRLVDEMRGALPRQALEARLTKLLG